jgi:hypothetical protein
MKPPKIQDFADRKEFLKAWGIYRHKSDALLDYHMYQHDKILLARMTNPAFANRFSEAEIDKVKARMKQYEDN